jgi:hypothetical protein
MTAGLAVTPKGSDWPGSGWTLVAKERRRFYARGDQFHSLDFMRE